MNEENQINYYAIIPATVRYSKNLKANEKLLYGEITALTNQKGYCFAQNRYFATLYNVTTHTVSQWISHLEKLGFIKVELIKNEKNEIQSRKLYIVDIPYVQNNTYPYVSKNIYPMYKKVQDNNIKYNKDDLFNLIKNKKKEIPKDFYMILEKLELIISEKVLSIIPEQTLEALKVMIYVSYDLYNSDFRYILSQINHETLYTLYLLSKERCPNNLIQYYKKTIINNKRLYKS